MDGLTFSSVAVVVGSLALLAWGIGKLGSSKSTSGGGEESPVDNAVAKTLSNPDSESVVLHCLHGHPITPENTYVYPSGRRICRVCARERKREGRKHHATI